MYGSSPQYFLTEEQAALRETVAKIAREKIAPRASEADQKAEYRHDVFDLLCKQGVIGMTLPMEYGGGGAGLLELCIVVEELAKVCTAAALMPVMSNIMGTMLIHGGSDAQKKEFLP